MIKLGTSPHAHTKHTREKSLYLRVETYPKSIAKDALFATIPLAFPLIGMHSYEPHKKTFPNWKRTQQETVPHRILFFMSTMVLMGYL